VSSVNLTIPQQAPSGVVWRIAWAILLAGGLILWGIGYPADPARAMRALLINFIYFTPMAAGMVVWSAVVITSRGHWAGRAEFLALSGLGFAPLSLLALVGLWMGADHWVTWLDLKDDRTVWLNKPFLFLRDLIALAGFWGLAFIYVRRRQRERCKTLGAWLTVVYCLVFSLLGFDLVMALDAHWRSTAFGMYYFISGMYIAAMAWTLIAAWHPRWTHDRLHDLGKIVFAFAIMTMYLVYAHLYPIWYENIPEETRFLVPRMNFHPWVLISWAILLLGWLGPLWMLLTVPAKRNRYAITGICIFVLMVMWVERWWLVVPTVTQEVQLGLPELSMLAAMLGGSGLGMVEYLRRVPIVEPDEESGL
jgi:hypothetical protein